MSPTSPAGPSTWPPQLQKAVADYVAATKGRLAFVGDDRAVIITGRPVNHILHLLLTIITGGLWILVWVYACATGGEHSHTLSLDNGGAVLDHGDRTTNTGQVRLPRVAGAVLAVVAVVALLRLFYAGALSPLVLAGVLVLGGGGIALVATDIRKYGTGASVPTVQRL